MTTEIELHDLPPQRLLVKKTTCGQNEIATAFGHAIHSVGSCLRASGGKMASMPMAIYLHWGDNDCDMAVGCKVEGEINLSDGCEWLEIPGGSTAIASHLGPYDTLRETHVAIQTWCAAHHHKRAGPCWESYPVDPGTQPDASKWQTDVHYPVSA